MRLQTYLTYSNTDESINNFRSMRIALTDKPQDYSPILSKISNEHKIDNIEETIKELNKELRTFYTGKYEYSLCLDSNKKINELKSIRKKTDHLTLALFIANDKLSKAKNIIENNLKKDLQISIFPV